MDNEFLLNLQITSRLSDYSTEMTVHSTLNTRFTYFEELKNAVEFCYRYVKVGEWTPAQGAAYLTLHGINRKWQSRVLINAENDYLYVQLKSSYESEIETPSQPKEMSDEFIKMQMEKMLQPQDFGKPVLSPK